MVAMMYESLGGVPGTRMSCFHDTRVASKPAPMVRLHVRNQLHVKGMRISL
jgi:hypothetical protein